MRHVQVMHASIYKVQKKKPTYGQKDVLQVAGHLSLDALLDLFAGNLAVLFKH